MAQAGRERPSRPPPPGSLASQSGNLEERLTTIQRHHDEAYLYIEQGLACDEQGHGEQAVTLYTKGLRSIDMALNVSHDGPECTGPRWNSAKGTLAKMNKTKEQITTRVEHLLASDSNAARSLTDPPPSYEVATTPTSSRDILTEEDFALVDEAMLDEYDGVLPTNATQLFSIDDGVQIFFITPEGAVSAPSYPSSLAVFQLHSDEPRGASNDVETPPAFLKVGDWNYPLIPGASPVLQANWGAYIFPDVMAPVEGSHVGVIIPDSVSNDQRTQLENLLNSFTALQHQAVSPTTPGQQVAAPDRRVREDAMEVDEEGEETTSTKVAKGLITAAEWIAWGLNKGAEKTGELMKKGSAKLKEQINPQERESKIDPRYQQGVYYVRQGTGVALKVSGFVVSQLGKATLALGRQIAPHVRKQGEKYLPKSMTQPQQGKSKMDSVIEVAAGGLAGFGTVYVGLESAAKMLARNLADETVTVVQHRYGSQAGQLTENTLYSAGNVGLFAHNVSNLGVKAIAKRAAKDTGRAVVEDYCKDKKLPKDDDQTKAPGGPGRPNQPPNRRQGPGGPSGEGGSRGTLPC